jgi:ribose/xylose/arabinose/galactoside ABC-type transport system permease subunit
MITQPFRRRLAVGDGHLARTGFTDPVSVFAFAIAVACAWQALLAAIVIYVRVPPIIVSRAGYLILQGVNLVILPRPGGTAPDWLSDWGYGTNPDRPRALAGAQRRPCSG